VLKDGTLLIVHPLYRGSCWLLISLNVTATIP